MYPPKKKQYKIFDETKRFNPEYNRKEVELVSMNRLRTHSEFFAHHITGYIPIMTQESLMELFAYHSQLGDYDIEAKPPKPEELALFYGIQGMTILRGEITFSSFFRNART